MQKQKEIVKINIDLKDGDSILGKYPVANNLIVSNFIRYCDTDDDDGPCHWVNLDVVKSFVLYNENAS